MRQTQSFATYSRNMQFRRHERANLVIGYWNNFFTHVPIHLATKARRMVELDGASGGVVSATQQDKTSQIGTN